MGFRKAGVQVTLDSTSVAVLKSILHQVETAKGKRAARSSAKNSTEVPSGQLPLLSDMADPQGDSK